MKSDYLEDDETTLGLEYLLTLEHFRQLMKIQMQKTAAEDLASKFNIRSLEASNAQLIKKNTEYEVKLKEEKKHFENTMVLKAKRIENLEEELAVYLNEADARLKKQILDSDRQMVLATRAHAIKAEMLKEEEIELREAYETMLKSHLIDEKNQILRKCKYETQLQSWLQKYDYEMGDKQVELDEVTQKYEDEIELCKELEVQLAEQDKEYIPQMEEREIEYHQEMKDKMNNFLLEHAARVIQCAWRDVLANRAEKKRLKKIQKKMQAAAAAAAAAATAAAAAAAAAAKKAAKAAKKK